MRSCPLQYASLFKVQRWNSTPACHIRFRKSKYPNQVWPYNRLPVLFLYFTGGPPPLRPSAPSELVMISPNSGASARPFDFAQGEGRLGGSGGCHGSLASSAPAVEG